MNDAFENYRESGRDMLDQFDALMKSVDKELEVHRAPEQSVEDIVSYVDAIRSRRIQNASSQS